MKRYKFITIGKWYAGYALKHPGYKITNNKSKDILGRLSYYPTWKQYVFESEYGAIFNNSCLRDILDFMENEIPKEEK